MAFKIEVKTEDRGVKELFKRLKNRMRDMTPAMKTFGEIITGSVIRNFEVGGRPQKWQKLAAATIKKKGHARPLIGETTNLMSIAYKGYSDRVVIGPPPSAKAYARIHQLGGRAGRGLKAIIPARPYLMVQNEDWTEIKEAARDHLSFNPCFNGISFSSR